MGTPLYSGTGDPRASGFLTYGQIPFLPQASGVGTPTLNTDLGSGNQGYAGYTNYRVIPFTLLNSAFPTLDPSTGFTFSFEVAVTTENSNPNRAGFSITVISSDGRGLELGFKEEGIGANDRIFAQSENATEAEDTNTDINSATQYELTVLSDTYTLSAGGTEILTGPLRNINFDPAASSPPLPFNPYTAPNFLFFGDNTDQGYATFTLGAISVNAFPVVNDDSYTTAEDTTLTLPVGTGVLDNDTDADNDLLNAVLVAGPTNGTLTLNNDGVFTYTPAANFSGTDSFTYRVNDGTAESNNLATVALEVDAVADAPTLTVSPASGDANTPIALNINAALVDTDGSENLSIQIAGVATSASLSAGTDLGGGVWQLTPAQLDGLTITPTATDNFNLAVTATATETSNSDAASTSATLGVTLNSGGTTLPTLTSNANDVFVIGGSGGQAQLQFNLTERDTGFVNEIGVFVVDDEQGTLNGIAPGQVGYLSAALSLGQVIFSALSDGVFPSLQSTRQLSFDKGDTIGFYLVQNSTTDTVLADLAAGRTPPNVFFATTSANSDGFDHLRVSSLGDSQFNLAWEDSQGGGDGDFNDLVLTVEATNQAPLLGTGLQRTQELIDLRNQQANLLSAEAVVNSEAAFDNFVGLYVVDDEQGTVNGIAPGQAGYAQAALQRRVLDLNQGTANLTSQLQGGTLLAPYIIADATPDEFLTQNPNNTQGQGPLAYFAYLGANPDGVDHIRLLGDNSFGFEDVFGGGDLDYNDMVFQVSFA